MLGGEVAERTPCAGAELRGRGSLHFDHDARSTPADQNQVDLVAGRRSVVVRLELRARGSDDVLDDEALVARPGGRVPQDRAQVDQLEQRVQQPAVSDEHLGRLHQPLADVRVPRRHATDEAQVDQQVDIAPRGRTADPKSRGQSADVEDLTTVVSQHRPEPAEGFGRNSWGEHGHVALQVGAQEVGAPLRRVAVVECGQAQRVATPDPQRVGVDPDVCRLIDGDAPHIEVCHAPCEALRRHPDQVE